VELFSSEQKVWLSNNDPLVVFDWDKIFQNNHPVQVDLGAGDGSFVIELAKRYPNQNFVAVERLLGRVRKIVKKTLFHDLSNVRVLRIESWYFLRYMCLLNSIDTIHVLFPDPWPKRKHHKNRLMQPPFIEAAARALKPKGQLRFTTDHEEYFQWTMKQWYGIPGWIDSGAWNACHDPRTDFQLAFETEGRPFYRNSWEKSE
jgi:tRNA (guanine-N7-)-methyltransferase